MMNEWALTVYYKYKSMDSQKKKNKTSSDIIDENGPTTYLTT